MHVKEPRSTPDVQIALGVVHARRTACLHMAPSVMTCTKLSRCNCGTCNGCLYSTLEYRPTPRCQHDALKQQFILGVLMHADDI